MNGRKITLSLVILTVLFAILAACGNRAQSVLEPSPQTLALSAGDSDESNVNNVTDISQSVVAQTVEQRIVLKDASIQIVVENVTATMDMITKLAEAMGGWVISSNTSRSTYTSGNDAVIGSIAIRVPSAQFTNAITQIKNQSTSVDAETITGKDVTQEYTDLNSQLTNLQAAEAQLQKILDSAQSTDDVLKIYNELVRVRGEIETTQGRINYYKQASDFSSITVSLRPPTIAQEAVQVDTGWSPATTVKGAFNALVNVLQGIANLIIIALILVLPLLLIMGIPAWLTYKLMRRFGWFRNKPRVSGSNLPTNTKVENDVG